MEPMNLEKTDNFYALYTWHTLFSVCCNIITVRDFRVYFYFLQFLNQQSTKINYKIESMKRFKRKHEQTYVRNNQEYIYCSFKKLVKPA